MCAIMSGLISSENEEIHISGLIISFVRLVGDFSLRDKIQLLKLKKMTNS
jgi:hypothetical protein